MRSVKQTAGDAFCDIGRQAELKHVDGDHLTTRGIVAMKNGAQAASPDLVQHTVAAEGRRWDVSRWTFRGHRLAVILPCNLVPSQ